MRRALPLLIILAAACAQPDPLQVHTQSGMLEGMAAEDGSGVRVFLGVPYARPPVGPGRWQPPSEPASWDGVRVADHYGAACWQVRGRTASVYTKGIEEPSEDCLYLNVWTPPAGEEPSPVMVWFHGGGNTAGEGGSAVFDGTHLAGKGVTLVTVNYRLGVFGFLAHPALTSESPHASSGNYGLLDQIAALDWVHANIAELGGDPSRVTIFGQSAGSTDTCLLMASPLAHGLFHRAIGQSGACLGNETPLQASGDAPSGHANGVRLASALGVEGQDASAAERLRAIDAETLHDARTGVGVGPIVDGWVIPRPPAELYASGDFNHVPLMTGWMADETKGLQPGLADVTKAEYEPRVRRQYGAGADRVLAAYASVAAGSTTEALFNMTTDAGMGAGARSWARAVTAAGDPTFLYHFSWAPPVFRLYITDDPHLDSPNGPRGMGAYHSGDLVYVFDNVGYVDVGWDDYDRHLADVLSSYWVSFARTGDPNAEGLPAWPRYEAANDELMHFGSTISAAPNPRAAELDLFDSLAGR